MKKIMSALLASSLLVVAAGCSDANKDETPEKKPTQTQQQQQQVTNVSVTDITTKIKEEIAAYLQTQGVGEEAYVDGKLAYYNEIDLVNPKEDDPSASIYLEKMGIDASSIKNGIVIAPMMNVKSDEIIVLEAKDEASVAVLQAALEKEKAAQVQTWEQYLPDQYEKVKNNVIKTSGNYLLYVTYDEPQKIEQVFDQFFK